MNTFSACVQYARGCKHFLTTFQYHLHCCCCCWLFTHKHIHLNPPPAPTSAPILQVHLALFLIAYWICMFLLCSCCCCCCYFSIFHSCVLAANNCVVTWLLCRTYVCSWDRLVPLLLLSLVVCYNSWQQLLWDAALLLCKRAIAALHEHFLVILLLLLLFLLFLCISVMIWLALLAHYYCYCFGFYLMYRNVFGVCDFSLLIFFLNVVYIFLCWKIRNHKFFS